MALQELPFEFQPIKWYLNLQYPQQQSQIEDTLEQLNRPSSSLVCFSLEIRFRAIYKWIVRVESGEMVLVKEQDCPIIAKTFQVDPRLFLNPSFSHSILLQIISQLRIPLRMNNRRYVIEQISSYASRMVTESTSTQGDLLFLSAEVLVVAVKLYDERTVIAQAIRESETQEGFGAIPASKSLIQSLKSIEFDDEDSITSSCSICLEELEVGSRVTQMPCFHVFHGDCITRWLETSHYCPICRFEMPI